MKFSLLYPMQISHPTRQSERQLFSDCVEQAVMADALGFHRVWALEHHGLREWSHSSAPEVFLSFVAARTERIRLGFANALTPYRYNHPLRVAERVATLDVLSGGRVDWGSSASWSLTEQLAFQNDVGTLEEEWAEALETIPRMWDQEVFSHEGRFYRIPPTQVVPKPLQEPHPPIYATCVDAESAKRIARFGVGALHLEPAKNADLEATVTAYRAAVASARVPRHRNVLDHFACACPSLVLDDHREAFRYGLRGARFYAESRIRYQAATTRPTGSLDVPREFLSEDELAERDARREVAELAPTTIVGDPEAAAKSIQPFVDLGVDELILIMQMGTVPHALTMKSLKTFAEKVAPAFA